MVLATRLVRTARHIVSMISAWRVSRIGIAVTMSSVKIIVVSDPKRSVSGIRIARGKRPFALRGVALSAIRIVIVVMDKPAAIISAKEGRPMNVVTMPIVRLVSAVLSDAASMIQAVALQTKIVRRISDAEVGDV